MFDLEYQLKTLPDSPGVYLMKDINKNIIYVGKAISLKNRVRQYFNSKNHHPKVESMVKNIAEFEYIITDSEVEALILECNLIKQHKPKYNILLRDDKTYPYIKITLNEDYPRILKVRKVQKDGSKYFGPYTNTYAVNDTLEIIRHMYSIRTCNIDIQKAIEKKQRPCLNYHIKKCSGPCTGNVKIEDYRKMIDEIMFFLSGKSENFIEKLRKQMENHVQNLEFENAAQCRDKINSLQEMLEKQKVISTNTSLDQDIIAMAKLNNEACIQVFFIRSGKIVGREHYVLEDVMESENSEILSSFIKQFYTLQTFIPKELIIEIEIEDKETIGEWLTNRKNQKVIIKVPQKGDKKDLIDMVKKNAVESLEKIINMNKNKVEKTIGVLEELKNILNLEKAPIRIEAFDISNIQGVDSVGSMVVFTNGKKDIKAYRRFKIKTVIGPNDYASMEEIVYRRLKYGNYPHLILLDGGLGQVSVVSKLLKDSNIDIPIWGMYKDNKHKTEGLISLDKEIKLDRRLDIYKFIASIQEEVHRFAIAYHRTLREKHITKSALDDIPNIGKKRKLALLSHFKTIENIKKSSIEELENIEGMNKKAAESIYEFFRKKG